MAAFYLKSGAGAAEFVQSNAYSLAQKIVPKRSDAGSNYLVARRWVWECTTAGTSAAAEPTWPAAVTQDVTTVTSGTATFTARKPGFSSGSTADWAFAAIYCDYINNATSGDIIYISDNHAEEVAGALSLGIAGVSFVCVDDSATPPTARATGAVIATSGANNLAVGNNTSSYWYGILFKVGVGDTGTRSLTVLAQKCESCDFEIATSGASSYITGYGTRDWINCRVKFAAAGQQMSGGPMLWSGGGLMSGGTSPTNLFGSASSLNGVWIENIDLSAAGAGINIINVNNAHRVWLRNIKMPASWSGAINAATPNRGAVTQAWNVGETATATDYEQKQAVGSTTEETTIVRAGGSATSVKLASGSGAQFPCSYIGSPEFAGINSSTGSAITVTVPFIHDSLTNLTDKDIWLEASYQGAADSPLGSMASSVASVMATAADCAADSSTWTTTGMTNPNEQKLTVTFTPQIAGPIFCTVRLAKASTTVYVDPVLQIS